MYSFLSSNNVIIGIGTFRKISNILENEKFYQPLFLVDSNFLKTKYFKKIKKNIKNGFFFSIPTYSEPTYKVLEKVLFDVKVILKKKRFDTLVGVGGGSTMDISKAVAALLTNKNKNIKSYRGFDKILNIPIPLFLAPTNAGTGSESSFNASFVDDDANIKMGINGKNMFCFKAIIDPELTYSCPKKPLVGSALDALVHTLEGYVSKKSNFLTDKICELAFELIINNIHTLAEKKIDPNKRLNLMIAAYLGGIIQMNAGSGIASCISYPLSVFYKVPHGIGGAMFLNDIIAFNLSKGLKKYENFFKYIYDLKIKNNNQFLAYLEKKFEFLKVPKKLNVFTNHYLDIDKILIYMKSVENGFTQNPIKFTLKKDLRKILINYL
jgi:alcohol dehydrogenase class IV